MFKKNFSQKKLWKEIYQNSNSWLYEVASIRWKDKGKIFFSNVIVDYHKTF